MLQILLGLYSLWDGFEWLRMVRRRLGSHAGFYAPVTALICPCKGNEPGLEENLTALTRFEYANYEIYFSLATSLDPALKIIERVKASTERPVHIVIAGPPEDCGEKVHNLRRAVETAAGQVRSSRLHRFGRALAARLAREISRAACRTHESERPQPTAGSFPAAKLAKEDLRAHLPRPGTLRSSLCSGGRGKLFAGEAAPQFAARRSTK